MNNNIIKNNSINQDHDCEKFSDTEKVHEYKKRLPSDDEALDIAEFLRVFSDFSRVKILFLLMQGEMKVCDIAKGCDLTHSATSHQLRVLKFNRLVNYKKDGKNVVYALADEHISKIINLAYAHITE